MGRLLLLLAFVLGLVAVASNGTVGHHAAPVAKQPAGAEATDRSVTAPPIVEATYWTSGRNPAYDAVSFSPDEDARANPPSLAACCVWPVQVSEGTSLGRENPRPLNLARSAAER